MHACAYEWFLPDAHATKEQPSGHDIMHNVVCPYLGYCRGYLMQFFICKKNECNFICVLYLKKITLKLDYLININFCFLSHPLRLFVLDRNKA